MYVDKNEDKGELRGLDEKQIGMENWTDSHKIILIFSRNISFHKVFVVF